MRYLLTAAALFLGTQAYACDCAEPPAPKKALDGAGAVFLGEAGNTHKDGDTCGYRTTASSGRRGSRKCTW